jgi:hypothetical protein
VSKSNENYFCAFWSLKKATWTNSRVKDEVREWPWKLINYLQYVFKNDSGEVGEEIFKVSKDHSNTLSASCESKQTTLNEVAELIFRVEWLCELIIYDLDVLENKCCYVDEAIFQRDYATRFPQKKKKATSKKSRKRCFMYGNGSESAIRTSEKTTLLTSMKRFFNVSKGHANSFPACWAFKNDFEEVAEVMF